jgi:hypothetical protein
MYYTNFFIFVVNVYFQIIYFFNYVTYTELFNMTLFINGSQESSA